MPTPTPAAPRIDRPAPAPPPAVTEAAAPAPEPAASQPLPPLQAPLPAAAVAPPMAMPEPLPVPQPVPMPSLPEALPEPIRRPEPVEVVPPLPVPAPAPAPVPVPAPAPAPAPVPVPAPPAPVPAPDPVFAPPPAQQPAPPSTRRVSPGTAAEPTTAPSFGGPVLTPNGDTGRDSSAPVGAPGEPKLNLSVPGLRRGSSFGGAAPGVLPLLPPPPERKAKITEELDKAGRADCRNAYSGMGLLAAVPLAVDAVKGNGCKW